VTRHTIAALVLVAASAPLAYGQPAPAPAQQNQQTKTLNLTAYAELLRSDVRTQKVAIITTVMGFTEAEDAAFWPIYRAYDTEMTKLGDERVALIQDYANNYGKMTNEAADKLALKAIELEQRRGVALAKCYDDVKKATSAYTALRFLQVEAQLQQLIDLQIAASLPLVK
jgi:hypothetical protein